MDYQLALAPDLGLSPADFVAVWNITTECRDAAEAHLLSQTQSRTSNASSYTERIALIKRADLDVTSHTIENLIKEVLKREGMRKVGVSHENTQDGIPLLTISSNDKQR